MRSVSKKGKKEIKLHVLLIQAAGCDELGNLFLDSNLPGARFSKGPVTYRAR